ncbi:hypothetical protein FNJ84_09085 [Paracoccus sp. M683]|uniref:hypothetical protein n=1 Tax=Paracoccus sp. M683 TaxID=2594268 RepID=UPI00117E7380|nr:hypothetical protein [Paracoccus sp. M683]TRW97640.1 hypothetical protein FNJ84_09085 [Paracoccus sp. M683]
MSNARKTFAARRLSVGAAILTLMPLVALAQEASWNCKFQTECLDNECAGSAYETSLVLLTSSIDAGIATVGGRLEDSAESLPMAGMDQNGLIRLFNIESATGARLLTLAPDGTARYTTHIADPIMSMTYLGRCEEAK